MCDALECAVTSMLEDERAQVVVCDTKYCIGEPQIPTEKLPTGKGSRVIYDVRLMKCEKIKSACTESAKLGVGYARKEIGARLFKEGRFALARQRWEDIYEMIGNKTKGETCQDDTRDRIVELQREINLNLSLVYLKMKDPFLAKAAATRVLDEQDWNPKALFRRASA